MKEIKLKNVGDKVKITRTNEDFMIVEVVKDDLGLRLVWCNKDDEKKK
jgi:hypothetical protein